MKKYKEFLWQHRYTLYLLALLAIGVAVRCFRFGAVPAGLNQDEAMAGYEAFSLLRYGTDIDGYRNPCYLVAWGSGMNALETYLMIPFLQLFGYTVRAIRLPQLILGCISLVVFYLLTKELFHRRAALLGLFLLAICPWHIMICRWALESNLAPAFLLFGFYFLVRGAHDARWWPAAALMLGLSLYAYAINWLVVPLLLLGYGICLLWCRIPLRAGPLTVSGAILLILALPLVLFLLVNSGILPEILTPLVSIPQLPVMRSGEISLGNLFSPESYRGLFNILVRQNDGLLWNSPEGYGLFYLFSLPFILWGGLRLARDSWRGMKRRELCAGTLVLTGFFSAVIACLLQTNLNVNKANSLLFFTLLLLTTGVDEACRLLHRIRPVPICLLGAYAIAFALFARFYFGSYNTAITIPFQHGLGDAVTYANQLQTDCICVDDSISYALILFYDQTPTDLFRNTVEYREYPAAFLSPIRFAEYEFGVDYNSPDPAKTYLIPVPYADTFLQAGFKVTVFSHYAVASF